MREQYTGDPPEPKEALIALLSRDFASPEDRATLADPEAGGIATFLASSRSFEDITERLASEECAQLENGTIEVLETAPITDSFKGLIAGYVVRAYAMESVVADVVSPSRLGLLSGDGIFDAEQAKGIEAQALRGYLFDIVNTRVLVAEDEFGEKVRLTIPEPDAYRMLMDTFDTWTLDYLLAYGEDAFAGVDPEVHMAAAKRLRLMSEAEKFESGWDDIIARLRQLRGGEKAD